MNPFEEGLKNTGTVYAVAWSIRPPQPPGGDYRHLDPPPGAGDREPRRPRPMAPAGRVTP
jgi:hypothetical protein